VLGTWHPRRSFGDKVVGPSGSLKGRGGLLHCGEFAHMSSSGSHVKFLDSYDYLYLIHHMEGMKL